MRGSRQYSQIKSSTRLPSLSLEGSRPLNMAASLSICTKEEKSVRGRPHIEDWFEETENLGVRPGRGRNRLAKLWNMALLIWLKEPPVPSIIQQVVAQCHASW
ncbi:hypothetical protein TNCV_3948521 [Trichonephila clavipes]|nr:hypothetical protein TNCV_3948521 [Trichonephila clavipes]